MKSIMLNKTEIKIIALKNWYTSQPGLELSACTPLSPLLQRLTHRATATVEK